MRLSKPRKEIVDAMMKERISEAAGSVIEQHGINGVTMDRVASTVGVATGSLYNYFHDKNELMQFIFVRVAEPYVQAIEEIANRNLPARQKLEEILHLALERSVTHKSIIRLLVELRQDRDIRNNTRPRFLQIFTSIFEQGIRDGTFRPHNPVHTGRMFLGCLAELFELQAKDTPADEVDGYVTALIDAAIRGFGVDNRNVISNKESPDLQQCIQDQRETS
jgi:AcrR family transcriptional regulator